MNLKTQTELINKHFNELQRLLPETIGLNTFTQRICSDLDAIHHDVYAMIEIAANNNVS